MFWGILFVGVLWCIITLDTRILLIAIMIIHNSFSQNCLKIISIKFITVILLKWRHLDAKCLNVNTTKNAGQRCVDITFSDPEPICIRKIRLEYVIIAGDAYTSWVKFEVSIACN